MLAAKTPRFPRSGTGYVPRFAPRRFRTETTIKPAPPITPETPLARYLLLATLICYAVVQLLWMQATPLQPITLPDNLPQARASEPLLVGLGPDEKEHYLYLLSLAETGRIPRPSPAYRTSPAQYVSYQAQHPPLFYAASALVYKAAHPALGDANTWYVLRGLCVLCGIAVIVLADKAAKAAFPNRPLVALATAPFVAFLPMFGHMTGNLSNEPLAMVFGAWVWLQSVRLLRQDTPATLRQAALLGATLAVACLTRLTALLWLPVMLMVLHRGIAAVALSGCPALASGRPSSAGGQLSAAGQQTGTQLAPPVLVAGLATFAAGLAPWLLFNQIAYGKAFLRTFDRPLLANGSLSDFFGTGIVPNEFPIPVNATQTALWYASTAWLPFWLTQFYYRLDGQPVDLRPVFLLLSAAAVIALVLNLGKVTRADGEPDTAGKAILWSGIGATLFCLAALVQQQLFSDWNVVLSAGRYLVAAAPATGLLFVFALSCVRPLNRPWFAAVLAALMLAFGLNTALTVRQYYFDHPAQGAVQRI